MTPNYSGIVTTVLTGGDLMDDFGTEADGTLPTSEWTATSGSFSMSSGTLSVSTNGSNGVAAMYFNGRGAVTNYQGQCSGTTVGTVPMGENGRYPAGAVRMSTDGGTFYTAFYDRGQIALWKFVNGTPSWVLPSGSYVYTAQTGDYIWICAEGSNITVKLMDAAGTMDGEIMSASDGDIATGYPGIWGQTTASGSTAGTATYWGGQTQGVMIETVGVSGDATCALGCPAGAYHYATVTNTDGTNGVNGYESGHVSPPTYIDFYWRQAYTWDELLGGVVPPNLTIGHDIICSELGNRQPCQ